MARFLMLCRVAPSWVWAFSIGRLRRQFGLADVVYLAIFVFLVCVLTLGPTLQKGGDIWSFGVWVDSFAVHWYMVLAALFLKFVERHRTRTQKTRGEQEAWVARRIAMDNAITNLNPPSTISKAKKEAPEIRGVREKVLRSVSSGVKYQVRLPEHARVRATLVDAVGDQFKSSPASKNARISARDGDGETQGIGRKTPISKSVYEGVLQSGNIKVFAEMRSDPRFRKECEEGFRSCVLCPIKKIDAETREPRTVAILQIDCSSPGAFLGRGPRMFQYFRPYLAVLGLTYPMDTTFTQE